MPREFINPPTVHRVTAYSHAVKVDNTVYVAGQVGRDVDGNTVSGGFEAQAEKALDNLRLVLEAAGATMKDVVKLNTYLKDMSDRDQYMAIRSRYFSAPLPASTLVQISCLADPAFLIEVEAVAVVD